MKKFLIIVTGCVLFMIKAAGQQFGGNPPRTRWKQVNTDAVRIIFPQGTDSSANTIREMIQQLNRNDPNSLGNKRHKINIVLQNRTSIANGYVGLGPFRSEFNLSPPSDNFELSSFSWPRQLALHEYRHVQQYNNFDNGISKVMHRLFGQDGYALAINAAIPNWFFEGDAVYQETALSTGGRGRLPGFLKAYPSLWEAGKNYSWMKLRNGSLKNYVPDHYDLGYLLVNYGTEKYGYDLWKKVTTGASAYKGLFYPMQSAIKRYSGLRYKDFISEAFAYYQTRYDSLYDKNGTAGKKVVNYYYPQQISEDEVLYLKTTYNRRPGFYISKNGEEKLLRRRDISIDEQYSYRNGKIVYTAYEIDPRWRWTNYSVIKILDVHTGRQKTLQHKTRYFSPDISEDGRLIVANEVKTNGQSSLVILDAGTGAVLREIQQQGVSYFANPKILDSNTVIAAIRNDDATTYISKINLNDKSITPLTSPSFSTLGQIDVKDDTVYFIASQKLKDQIFCLDMKAGQLAQLKTSGVGDYFISSDHGMLSWSRFTANGYRLQQLPTESANWQPVAMDDFVNVKNGIVSNPQPVGVTEDAASTGNLKIKKYPQLTRPFNFHSWRPNYNDPEFSFTIYGNNILNTIETQAYYLYNQNDNTHAVGGTLLYGGLLPYVSLNAEYTFNKQRIISNKLRQWNEWNNSIGFNIPLIWSTGRNYKILNLGSTYHYRSDFNTGPNQNNFRSVRFGYLQEFFTWGQQVPTAVQDIYPRLGYNINLQYRHALDLFNSRQLYSRLNIYLPGIARAQTLLLSGAAQYTGNTTRIFSSRVPIARGYGNVDSAGVFTLSANYHLPLVYPDWGFGNIFYMQRVRANIFYDRTKAFDQHNIFKPILQSAGAEIYFDTKWWNQHPVSFGFITGGLINPLPGHKKWFFEFVLPVSLIPR